MNSNIRNIVVSLSFTALIGGVMVANIIYPSHDISASERRHLAQGEAPTIKTLLDGSWFSAAEGVCADQFILREPLRAVRAYSQFYLLNRADNHDISLYNGSAVKLYYATKTASAAKAAAKINEVYARYLSGMSVYFAMVPDKASTLSGANLPLLDEDAILRIMDADLVSDIVRIDLSGTLSLKDYYATDSHWRQENLQRVIERLAQHMGFVPAQLGNYERVSLEGFNGVYASQAALPLRADTLTYLTCDLLSGSSVYDYEKKLTRPVYDSGEGTSLDMYDIFLGGARPLLRIDVPGATGERELIIFRDSYSSSLAPLLCGSYKSVTLVDLRYISSSLLGEYIDFDKQDILFCLSSAVLNSGELLK